MRDIPPLLPVSGKDFAPGMLVTPGVLHYDGAMKERSTQPKELWPGGIRYAGESAGADSLALAAFASTPSARRGADLGCGCGILLLLLAREAPELAIDGVELRPGAAALCRENIIANGLEGRCRVFIGDWRELPPAAGELDLGLAAAARLRSGGDFCLVHRTERLAEVFAALQAAGLEPKHLRFFAPSPDKAPALFLCRARKGAGSGLRVDAPLYQFGADGAETEEYRKICHWEEQP